VIGKVIVVDSPLSGNKIKDYEFEFMVLRKWLSDHHFKLTRTQGFNREKQAALKKVFINRPFPEYRTTVYIYSKG
jgi:hypothetical protein